jgi:putative phage-type endonuclease
MSTVTLTPLAPWSNPDATQVLPCDAPRERWLAERRKGIGGSDASTIAGVNRFSSRYELWLDKTGRLPEKHQSDAMRWGTLLEPSLRQAFVEDTGLTVHRAGLMRSKAHPFMQVSLDGNVGDGGIFESKCTNWRMADDWEGDQIADHAEVQVQHGLAVTGRSHAHVVALIDGNDFQIRRVERDEAFISLLTEMEQDFWETYVLGDKAPPVDAAALGAVKARWSLVEKKLSIADPEVIAPLWEALKAAKVTTKAAEKAQDLLEAQMRELLADGEVLVAGGKAYATCVANGTFSSKRFAADHPDLAASLMTKPSFDLDRVKTEHPDMYAQYRARVLRPATTLKEI